LNSVQPDFSYFGEKDLQQLQIIRRMHRDLQLPGHIVASPTVRDSDGVALSSRNARLSARARNTARRIPTALATMADAARSGVCSVDDLEDLGRQALAGPGLRIDYLAIVNPETLEPVENISGNCRVLLAAEIEGVRLIDNIALTPGSNCVEGGAPA
jgi:pantoate--beta-alanine ligase